MAVQFPAFVYLSRFATVFTVLTGAVLIAQTTPVRADFTIHGGPYDGCRQTDTGTFCGGSTSSGPTCPPGKTLSSGGLCMTIGDVDCGAYSCNPGDVCCAHCGAHGEPSCMPKGGMDCGQGYCARGSVCTSHGCMPSGWIDCGTYSCQPGNKCLSGGGCAPLGHVDCGHYSCSPGNKCSIGGGCIGATDIDCGSYICGAGNKCSIGAHCIPEANVDCVGYSCTPGNKCSSGNTCISRSTADCGGGHFCKDGWTCGPQSNCVRGPHLQQLANAESAAATNLETTKREIAKITERLKGYQLSLDQWVGLAEDARTEARQAALSAFFKLTLEKLQEAWPWQTSSLPSDPVYKQKVAEVTRYINFKLNITTEVDLENRKFLIKVLTILKSQYDGARELMKDDVEWYKIAASLMIIANKVVPNPYSELISISVEGGEVWVADVYAFAAQHFSRERVDQLAKLQGSDLAALKRLTKLYQDQYQNLQHLHQDVARFPP